MAYMVLHMFNGKRNMIWTFNKTLINFDYEKNKEIW